MENLTLKRNSNNDAFSREAARNGAEILVEDISCCVEHLNPSLEHQELVADELLSKTPIESICGEWSSSRKNYS